MRVCCAWGKEEQVGSRPLQAQWEAAEVQRGAAAPKELACCLGRVRLSWLLRQRAGDSPNMGFG